MRPSKATLEQFLNLFPEVRWDRFLESDDEFDVYGWIDRDDGRSDFLLFEFTPADGDEWDWCYMTSSAQFSAEFSRRLNELEGSDTDHSDCQRVEDLGLNVNAIRLSTSQDRPSTDIHVSGITDEPVAPEYKEARWGKPV